MSSGIKLVKSDPDADDAGTAAPGSAEEAAANDAREAAIARAMIAQLARMDPIEYGKCRAIRAKQIGINVGLLDKLVTAERRAQREKTDTPFADVKPSEEPVKLGALLYEMAETLGRFIVCDGDTITATVLWCAAAWVVHHVSVCPFLLINAPEKACGKTQMLTLVGKLVPRPAQLAGISPAVLFRMIETYQPTLLVDEIETVLTKEAEDLRGMMNAGHTRESAFVWRNVPVGDAFEPKRFNVFGFKAIAGINADKLSGTITSRSIVVQMRRKKPSESAERLRHAPEGLFDSLQASLARWALDDGARIATMRPDLPDKLSDRDQDNWEPLLAVADMAGGKWPAWARRAALRLNIGEDTSGSAGEELLSDIRQVFERRAITRIAMADLLQALFEDDEAPWKTWNRGKEMTARQFGKKLSEFGIKAKQVKVAGTNCKGYLLGDFSDAFERYLSPSTPSPP